MSSGSGLASPSEYIGGSQSDSSLRSLVGMRLGEGGGEEVSERLETGDSWRGSGTGDSREGDEKGDNGRDESETSGLGGIGGVEERGGGGGGGGEDWRAGDGVRAGDRARRADGSDASPMAVL